MKTTIMIFAISLLTCTSALAATASGNLNLSGTIAEATSITVTPHANASALTLTSSAADLQIATVDETSNATNGYLIKAKSTNGSKLVHSSDSSQLVNYTIKYAGGSAVTLTTSDQTVKTQSTGGTYNAVSSNVTISYSAVSAATRIAGTYTDTITFTIEGQ